MSGVQVEWRGGQEAKTRMRPKNERSPGPSLGLVFSPFFPLTISIYRWELRRRVIK